MGMNAKNVTQGIKILNTVLGMNELYPSKWVNDRTFRENPYEGVIYGNDCKLYDGKFYGYEELFAFKEGELTSKQKETFEKLASKIGNTSFCKKYDKNTNFTILGWF